MKEIISVNMNCGARIKLWRNTELRGSLNPPLHGIYITITDPTILAWNWKHEAHMRDALAEEFLPPPSGRAVMIYNQSPSDLYNALMVILPILRELAEKEQKELKE